MKDGKKPIICLKPAFKAPTPILLTSAIELKDFRLPIGEALVASEKIK